MRSCLLPSTSEPDRTLTMTVYSVISLFLWYFGHLSVICQIAVADRHGPPFYKCTPQICWIDTSGAGAIADEPLADYITPDTAILTYEQSLSGSRHGDIVVYMEKSRPRLSSAGLGTTIIRNLSGTYIRHIKDPHSERQIGYMHMERPVSDLDTTFGSWGQDWSLAVIPQGLRSAVNPASLLPASNGSCKTTRNKCLVTVAVSMESYWRG